MLCIRLQQYLEFNKNDTQCAAVFGSFTTILSYYNFLTAQSVETCVDKFSLDYVCLCYTFLSPYIPPRKSIMSLAMIN